MRTARSVRVGVATRASSRAAATASGAKITPNTETITSADASGNGIESASTVDEGHIDAGGSRHAPSRPRATVPRDRHR